MSAHSNRHSVLTFVRGVTFGQTEQSVLRRMSSEPFIVKLLWSFYDSDNLYLVLKFLPGGDMATQLSRWGRLGRDRARFYTCEIVEGVEALHAAGVIYRDLKPGEQRQQRIHPRLVFSRLMRFCFRERFARGRRSHLVSLAY